MTDDHSTDTADPGTAEKDPADWTTGDEPMTGPQRSYLETLLQQAGEDAPDDLEQLSKSEASRRIDALQEQTGRGQ
ncbi:DUF3072 domain-containing protein [Pseudonocardia endophytica]|uniref:DUF3072 family protein n=1 Tax=Pseudonocardia endophytica TaxID=401976 RepID=A0A4R1HM28_PSEEN|nr:DUF3072 domain-containing protein [Pseudonocardia endophytica]TCK23048.1 DUF3072 family protein [Pseudonocardia endophytica]